MASVCNQRKKKANEKEEDMNPNNSLNFKITPKAGGRWLRWVCDIVTGEVDHHPSPRKKAGVTGKVKNLVTELYKNNTKRRRFYL